MFSHLDYLATILPPHLEAWMEHLYAFRALVDSTMRMTLGPIWKTDHRRFCETLDTLKEEFNLTENVKSHTIRR